MRRFERFFTKKLIVTGFIITLLALGTTTYVAAGKIHGTGYLGVSVAGLSTEDKEELGVTHGVLVTDVVKGEAADKAGIKEDDVIQYFNDEKIRRTSDLVDAVRETRPKTDVKIKLVRDKKTIVVTATLGRFKSVSKHFFWPEGKGFSIHLKGGGYLGIYMQKLNEDLAKYFAVKADEGVLILKVEKDSPAQKSGLKSGDVIVQIDDEKVSNPDDIYDILSELEEGDKIQIKIIRHRNKKTLTAELDERPGIKKFKFFKWPRRCRKLDIFKWHDKDRCIIEIPEIHVDIPDFNDWDLIIHKNLKKVKKRLKEVREKVYNKLKHIEEYIYI